VLDLEAILSIFPAPHIKQENTMPSPKRKASAKRSTARPNAKSYAASAAAAATRSAPSGWASNAASKPQSEASKLYQFPYGSEQVSEATRQAAESVQSATENMMKMGQDMMNTMFNQKSAQGKASANPFEQWQGMWNQGQSLPGMEQWSQWLSQQTSGFDTKSADRAQGMIRDWSEQLQRGMQGNKLAAELNALVREQAEMLVESGNSAISLSKELGAEWVSYANRSFVQNVELSKQVLGCRTFNDFFDLVSRFLKTNLEGFFSETVRASERVFEVSHEISEPVNESVSKASERLTKAMFQA
jgi:hypothetical protein